MWLRILLLLCLKPGAMQSAVRELLVSIQSRLGLDASEGIYHRYMIATFALLVN
jgi:hypothetical protein